MSNALPELGSKISLISKADIRYEGRLYQVDPQECTIALSSVRSFGTEDRDTSYPVPAQSQIYEYILFRGSDIKDIRVVTSIPPQDPAIVQLVPPIHQSYPPSTSVFPGYGGGTGTTRQQPTAPIGQLPQPQGAASELSSSKTTAGLPLFHHPLHPLFPVRSSGSTANNSSSVSLITTSLASVGATGAASSVAAAVAAAVADDVTAERDRDAGLIGLSDLLGGSTSGPSGTGAAATLSRSTTPSLTTRKSPTIVPGTQVQPGGRQTQRNNSRPRPIQPPRRDGQQQQQHQHQHQHQQHQQSGGYGGENRTMNNKFTGNFQNYNNNNRYNQPRPPLFHNRNQHEYRDNNQGGRRNGPMPGNRPTWNPRGPAPPRGGGGIGGTSSGPRRTSGNTPLKFESDFDFDKANTEFEELRSQLGKLKVNADGSLVEVPASSGENEKNGEEVATREEKEEKKEEEGGKTITKEGDTEESVVFYDKKKSFFDLISCEALERSKGRLQRVDWRTERKLNSETFGVASARRNIFHHYYSNNQRSGGNPRMYPNSNSASGYHHNYRNNSNNYHRQSRNQQQPHLHNTNNADATSGADAQKRIEPESPKPVTIEVIT